MRGPAGGQGVSTTTQTGALREVGRSQHQLDLQREKTARATEARAEAVWRAREAQVTWREIAEELGVSRMAASKMSQAHQESLDR